MMKARTLFFRLGLAAVLFLAVFMAWGAQDTAYYKAAVGKSRYELKTALHNIIKGHKTVDYDDLFDAYKKTDVRANGKVWDMYSNCDFGFNDHGSSSKECDNYNREHSFPKSWFGGKVMPMFSDLFHIYPTDGYVNNRRSNYPFGEVNNATYTSHNGSKVGPNTTSGYSGTVFEPVDEYKGDFARTYFYMATRYEDKIANWSACPVCDGNNNKASFKKWVIDLLLEWHRQDPVSQKEIDRNNAVYGYQHNRNPFIDFPELVEKIWGSDNTAFNPNPRTPDEPDDPDDPDDPDNPDDPDDPTANEDGAAGKYRIYPNPTDGMLTLDVEESNYNVRVFTASGVEVRNLKALNGKTQINLEGMAKGIYVVEITTAHGISHTKIVLR